MNAKQWVRSSLGVLCALAVKIALKMKGLNTPTKFTKKFIQRLKKYFNFYEKNIFLKVP